MTFQPHPTPSGDTLHQRCFECQQAIPVHRLAAMPRARNCEACSAAWRATQSKLGRLIRAPGSRSTHRRVH